MEPGVARLGVGGRACWLRLMRWSGSVDRVLAAMCAELALAWGGFVALVRLSSPPAVNALAPLSVCMNVCVCCLDVMVRDSM